jgi:hypothetical protein
MAVKAVANRETRMRGRSAIMISSRPPTAEREGRIGIEASPAVGFDQYHLADQWRSWLVEGRTDGWHPWFLR